MMPEPKAVYRSRVVEVIDRIGKCVELVPLDPNFHDISVGLYVKNGTATVWTFNQKSGVEKRITEIRDQLVGLGGMESVENTHNQVRFECGQIHRRPLKFLTMQAVERPPDYRIPVGPVKDLRSPLNLSLVSSQSQENGAWVYRVDATGEARNRDSRIRAVLKGMVRYGDMGRAGEDGVSFDCKHRHDLLTRLVLPFARNLSGVEDMLDEAAMRGQMTTGTLGFSPPT